MGNNMQRVLFHLLDDHTSVFVDCAHVYITGYLTVYKDHR